MPAQPEAVILARLDERTRAMSEQMADLKKGQADVSDDLDQLKREVAATFEKQRLEHEKRHEEYVTKAEFALVRGLVFGGAGLILVGFITGLIALLWKGGTP